MVQCSVTCGVGRVTRLVACSAENAHSSRDVNVVCDDASKPDAERECVEHACVTSSSTTVATRVMTTEGTVWRSGPWGAVSETILRLFALIT